jgi:hypothetical protein
MGLMARSRRDEDQFGSLSKEYAEAEFGDARLSRRLVQLARGLAAEPAASFPDAAGNDAALEATYRFLSNERVTADEIMAPHVRQTVRRGGSVEAVVVAHDTTEFNFGRTRRQDLGAVGRGKSFGFYGHMALALAREGRLPLGVLGFLTHSRKSGKGRRGHSALQVAEDNEGRRWLQLVRQTEQRLGGLSAIHVMDREADCYTLMHDLVADKSRFVIRMAGDKRPLAHGESETVGEALRHAEIVATREVPLSPRGKSTLPSYRKHYPARQGRQAKLAISATQVTLRRPDSASQCCGRTLTLNVVRVFEPEPPPEQPAVEWRLWTTEPVDTVEHVLEVVDEYLCRWVIEEFFRALKSGCQVEARQLETEHALVNALAVLAPVAWRLLTLRTLSRCGAGQPAERALTSTQIACLRAGLRRLNRPDLPSRPTVRDAMLGVAGLGGHIRNNGEPGWIVLGRGLDALLLMEVGWIAHQDAAGRCDQS